MKFLILYGDHKVLKRTFKKTLFLVKIKKILKAFFKLPATIKCIQVFNKSKNISKTSNPSKSSYFDSFKIFILITAEKKNLKNVADLLKKSYFFFIFTYIYLRDTLLNITGDSFHSVFHLVLYLSTVI